ncbi:CotH kinase family protein [candidate division KSB1 bacterium]|nr:CotH kinase family protein [candidate division KSB1 bacterium]
MSANSASINDEDGDTPDWIELYNNSTVTVDLAGFGLSDDAAEPFKWRFPSLTLDPHEFLIVFASNKDRREWLHWETVIDWGDQWRYRLGTSAPPVDWRSVEFNDLSWYQGASGFGYGDNDDATVVPQVMSLFVRTSFTITDKSKILKALLHVDFDDGFVAYLNDVEVSRANVGTFGDHPAFNQPAITYREAQLYQGLAPDVFILDDVQSLFRDGKNVLAIQVHNSGIESSDLSLIPFLSIGLTTPLPGSPRGMSPFLNPIANYLHTNFKINAEGERIALYHLNGQLLDQIDTGQMPTDISLGRQPDGSATWLYFDQPTPGESNRAPGYAGFAREPIFSHAGGFYSQGFLLSLAPSSPQASIYYSLDGSLPTTLSNLYQSPIPIGKTTVVRAREMLSHSLPGTIITHTYFINEKITLPVVSLTTDPPNLWDPDSGIYVLGTSYDPNQPNWGANFWEDWERPVHVEFFELDGRQAFKLDAGMKIYGAWSRAYPQKSVAIFARGRYGAGEINYQIFPDKPITKFESFILRNSGNDWYYTLFRDAMMQSLISETDVDIQAYRPAVVFLNGAYWGIHNIREKINEHYIAANHKVDPDNIDLLENNSRAIHGDATHYQAMLNYISTQNMQLPATLDAIKTMIAVDNFMDYEIAQIYFDNTDWPGNNVKFWRPRTADGRWKWIMFDTDFGFGLYNPNNYKNNSLAFATEPNGPDWPNPPWSTFLLRKLLEHPQFKIDFLNRFADHLNATFLPNRVNQRIDELKAKLEPEIQRHQRKWTGAISNWQQNTGVLKQFANNRGVYLKAYLIAKFQLKGTARITLNVVPQEGGQIKLNSLAPSLFPWQGDYFKELPIHVAAIPTDGFHFVGWSDSSFERNTTITLIPSKDLVIEAKFKKTEITSVAMDAHPIDQFSLDQNYPNPFNFSTSISYELSENCFVTITIFNLQGQEIAALVNRDEPVGRHQIKWNGLADREISNGVYFYKMEAASKNRHFVEIKKMLYLK